MASLKEKKYIDAEDFGLLVASGAHNLKENKQEVNDLNVFPIPDGDTGDNMYMTMGGGVSSLSDNESDLGTCAKHIADGMILGARGNSGVILSQFFAGIAKGLEGIARADMSAFKKALAAGVKQAYAAVVTPVEGTVLTVMREATECMEREEESDESLLEFLEKYVEEMKRSLERTPDLLDVLAEAGVVDSGGAGLVAIFEGMLEATKGKEFTADAAPAPTAATLDFTKFTEDSVMAFGYCTELLLRLQRSKVDNPESFDIGTIISYLETIGDSIAAFMTGTIVKIHVHTMTPHKVLEFCQQFGEFLTIKIENMTLQHNETEAAPKNEKKSAPIAPTKRRARRKFALVTTALGRGLSNTFSELGADIVIDGGQTKNPSVEDFTNAFDAVNADNIFVLPNNSNIIMAASSAKEVYEAEHADTRVFVVKTTSFGEAYSALSMLDYSSDDPEQILCELNENKNTSVTGLITTAIRTVSIDGIDITEGDYIGFSGKTMLTSNKNKQDSFSELLKKLGAAEREFIICFFGKDVSEEDMVAAGELVTAEYPSAEFYPVASDQEVYDYIVIME